MSNNNYDYTYTTGVGHTSKNPHVHGEKIITNPVTGVQHDIITPGVTNPVTGHTHGLGTNTYGTTGTGVYNTNPGYNNNMNYNNPNYNNPGYSNVGYTDPNYIQTSHTTTKTGYTVSQPQYPVNPAQTISPAGMSGHTVAGQTGYTNVAFTGNNSWTTGSQYGWTNPHGLKIPIVPYAAGCKKCHGTGTSKSMFSGTPMPCTRCYSRAGYCKKCYGTGVNFRKNKPCTKCQSGMRLKKVSSSSSQSDWYYWSL